jgi:hypothetical protein
MRLLQFPVGCLELYYLGGLHVDVDVKLRYLFKIVLNERVLLGDFVLLMLHRKDFRLLCQATTFVHRMNSLDR